MVMIYYYLMMMMVQPYLNNYLFVIVVRDSEFERVKKKDVYTVGEKHNLIKKRNVILREKLNFHNIKKDRQVVSTVSHQIASNRLHSPN